MRAALGALLAAFGAALASPQAPPPRPPVLVTVTGVINPFTARYLERGLRHAAETGGPLIVALDTPGGLESSMREMIQEMMASPVPVIVFVSPSGGRAASAGMFLTIAGHVAAMAPGTNIGSAHPVMVGRGGPDAEESDAARVMGEKVLNDAAALARGIATQRGRNAEWAERAVRESVSITAEEAVRLGVVDLVAADLAGLLEALDGRRIEAGGREHTLRTAGAEPVELPMSLPERVLHAITDPNVAYILMTLGMIGLMVEFYSPGLLFPGIAGLISLVLAFTAFGSLPVAWAGVVLVVVGLGLLALELYVESMGLLAGLGTAAFVLGSLMLYRPFSPPSPAMPQVAVDRRVIAGAAALGLGTAFFIGRAALRSRRRPIAMGKQALLGARGVALTEFGPEGTVAVEGEKWTARREDGGAIHPGEPVRVVGLEGVVLVVRKEVEQ